MVVTVGRTNEVGCASTTTSTDATDVQLVVPEVTVKLYVVEAFNPVKVVVVPLPVIAPGLIVQFPDGNPLKATLPVAVPQVGCVIVSIVGAAGEVGFVKVIGPASVFAELQPAPVVLILV